MRWAQGRRSAPKTGVAQMNEVALENFKKALALNKDYEKARSWVEKTTKEIHDHNAAANAAVDVTAATTAVENEDVSATLPPAP